MSEALAHRQPEAARRVGVSFSTLRRWVRNGSLRTIEIDGVVLVTEADLAAFLEAHRQA